MKLQTGLMAAIMSVAVASTASAYPEQEMIEILTDEESSLIEPQEVIYEGMEFLDWDIDMDQIETWISGYSQEEIDFDGIDFNGLDFNGLDWLTEPNTWVGLTNTKSPQTLLYQQGYSMNDAIKFGCKNPRQIPPSNSEIGDLAVARLSPIGYPFIADSVSYVLVTDPVPSSSGTICDAGLAHTVYVFVASSYDPGVPPNLVDTVSVPASNKPSKGVYEFTHQINQVELDGEFLFVAVEMNGSSSSNVKMCITACRDDYDANTNYWSENGAISGKSYQWKELGTAFNIQADYNITAHGWVPPASVLFKLIGGP